MLDVVHLHQEAEPGGDAAEERRPFGESGGHVVLVDLEGAQELPEHRGEVDHPVPAVVRQVDVELAVGEEPVQLTSDGLGDELRLADPADPDHQHDARFRSGGQGPARVPQICQLLRPVDEHPAGHGPLARRDVRRTRGQRDALDVLRHQDGPDDDGVPRHRVVRRVVRRSAAVGTEAAQTRLLPPVRHPRARSRG
ncbi:hypothetical protein [Streptomyces parvus]|uniref:hypothetical protein n=1 Tax=Streptomyces parvus TaxID=66428 RepID=UPI0036E8AE49